jgi:hypothetical protein
MNVQELHTAGGTEVDEEILAPVVSWLRREPVLAATLASVTAPLAALIVELGGSDTNPTVAVVLGGAVALINVVGIVARRVVTPTADPKLDAGVRLVPEWEEDGWT